MATNVRFEKDVLIVEVAGKMMGGPETEECHHMVKSLVEKGHHKVVVDLSRAEWVNSRGMGILMACYTTNQRLGGDLRFASLTEKTKSLFHITKLDTIFKIFDNVNQAVTSFR